ncbi:MAG: hypothetical protein FWH31_01660 [Streptococcaceae bacterium]|nr:hypothetical protein [Streptococcaceae bacterium]
MKKIIVNLSGRTGNQLLCYAFARKNQEQYGGKIILNFYSMDITNGMRVIG